MLCVADRYLLKWKKKKQGTIDNKTKRENNDSDNSSYPSGLWPQWTICLVYHSCKINIIVVVKCKTKTGTPPTEISYPDSQSETRVGEILVISIIALAVNIQLNLSCLTQFYVLKNTLSAVNIKSTKTKTAKVSYFL